MVPSRDRTRDPWICSQTCICSQTRYQLRYAARYHCQGMQHNLNIWFYAFLNLDNKIFWQKCADFNIRPFSFVLKFTHRQHDLGHVGLISCRLVGKKKKFKEKKNLWNLFDNNWHLMIFLALFISTYRLSVFKQNWLEYIVTGFWNTLRILITDKGCHLPAENKGI